MRNTRREIYLFDVTISAVFQEIFIFCHSFNINILSFFIIVIDLTEIKIIAKLHNYRIGNQWFSPASVQECASTGRERVVGDGATCEWIPIVSGVPQGVCWVFYTSKRFEMQKQIICPCRCLQTTGSFWQASRQP